VALSVKRKTAGGKRESADKVKFLAVLPAANIKAMKLRAVDRGVTASEALEEAAAAWLKLNRNAEPRLLVVTSRPQKGVSSCPGWTQSSSNSSR
jgi:hypothetical protein